MTPRNQILLGILVVALAFQWQQGQNADPDKPSPFTPGPNKSRMVLLVSETEPKPPYTADQFSAITRIENGDIRQWINGNYAPNGFRRFDPDDDLKPQDGLWRDAYDANDTPPYLKVYNGRRWSKAQPFADADEAKKIIGVK